MVVVIARHHVGPVDEIGDAAEALGLALRAEIAAGLVETAQARVVLRLDAGLDVEREAVRHVARGRGLPARLDSGSRRASRRRARARPAPAPRRRAAAAPRRSAEAGLRRSASARLDRGRLLAEIEGEIDAVDQESRAPGSRQAGPPACGARSREASGMALAPPENGLALLHEGAAALDVVLAGEAAPHQLIAARGIDVGGGLRHLGDDALGGGEARAARSRRSSRRRSARTTSSSPSGSTRLTRPIS